MNLLNKESNPSTKVSKHIKIKKLQEVNKTTLKYYIKQALKLDKK